MGQFGSPGLADGTGSAARFVGAYGLAANDAHLFVSTAHAIRRVNLASGVVDTLAGSGSPGGKDGQGAAASFNCPRGLVVHSGVLYVADQDNDKIRSVDLATGTVKTHAQVNKPVGLAFHPNRLYVTTPTAAQLRWVSYTGGALTQVGGPGNPPVSEPLELVWIQALGLFYMTDADREVVRKVGPDQINDYIAVGADGQGGFADGAQSAGRLKSPHGITARDNPLTLYIADRENHSVRRVLQAGYNVSTIAGDGSAGHAVGIGKQARLTEPTDVAYVDGTLYIAEGTVIRKITVSN